MKQMLCLLFFTLVFLPAFSQENARPQTATPAEVAAFSKTGGSDLLDGDENYRIRVAVSEFKGIVYNVISIELRSHQRWKPYKWLVVPENGIAEYTCWNAKLLQSPRVWKGMGTKNVRLRPRYKRAHDAFRARDNAAGAILRAVAYQLQVL